ncbi:COP23 domain-containing protein [Aetokthonos hydrillicola Thurmond2011]|jgi:hypothetical protein|uniref:COP23 domain-containing protein n=1 Tax=Aetokthonos hydrillicola Thurmond2011 TaxID=2712845 RepID=A0AAP5IBS6_9CYAN|nr:COP23 domain-containing protein [Aetokthonos hydrillicola]MBO3460434.1 hypothetical protein [Aetokthonos hydrillicola CCALA 1050]MBW4588490.1 COP23 domain-containing protein [Aetokthonos hydrillicola CCALA 1050]MDR9896818.1 COP23 domain-containing protein [Aetokthonos hydrillicola Thurmond2011]
MKIHQGICVLVASVLTAGSIAVANRPVQAESINFTCEKNDNGTFTTFGITANGRREFINWTSEAFILAGYTPEKRCQQVTNRMNKYQASGERYLINGTMNNLPVICVTDKIGHGCTGLLYTLKPRDDGRKALHQLFRLNDENFKNDPRQEGKACRTYVDINAVINKAQKTAEVKCHS